jgi:sulfide dehydrogenase cytochrome subunit
VTRVVAALAGAVLFAAPVLADDRAPPGALSCSGCHGSGGEMLPRLSGRPASETVAALAGFRSGERPGTLMGRIARGFTDDEARAIAAWLERQR